MLNVRLAGDHLNGKLLFTWLSLVMSLMVSFCGVLFPIEMSWMRAGIELSQCLRVFLPTLSKLPYGNLSKYWSNSVNLDQTAFEH